MAKIKLGATPKSFPRTVTFDMLDGTKGSIRCEYKYRTRKEFGVFIDGILAAAKMKTADGDEPHEFSMADLMERTAGSNADYVLQVLDGWNLDEDLTRENVEQLSDEIPAAALAIMETYRLACVEGRTGN